MVLQLLTLPSAWTKWESHSLNQARAEVRFGERGGCAVWKQVWDRSEAEITCTSRNVKSEQSREAERESGAPRAGVWTNLTPHWPSMPSRDNSGGRKARSCLSRAHSNRQGSPLHPVSLFTSSLFLYLPVFYLCLPVLNYNLLLHSKALYAPGSTEAKLPHHHRSCPRSARREMGCNPCHRGGTETSRNNNSNLVSRWSAPC